MDAVLTSFSASLKRLVKIYINETLSASSPKASAISAKILERESLTLQDLSSVAAIIIGRVCYLFSSFLKTLATNFNEFKPSTRTISYSSEINCFTLWIKSVRTYSFSMTEANSPILEATARRTMGVSSLQSSINLALILSLCCPARG